LNTANSLAARPVRTVTAASARRTASAGLARRALSFRPCRVARRNAVCVVEEAPKSKPAPKPKKISQLDLVEEELADHKKVMIAATAPAVRLGISEEFGLPPGTNSQKKLVSALRHSGFDFVFGALPLYPTLCEDKDTRGGLVAMAICGGLLQLNSIIWFVHDDCRCELCR